MHSHLLPGIDDGAPDMESSLELIQALHQLGYHQICTTPHVMAELYPNGRKMILRKRDEVQEALEELGLEIQFDAAAEYYLEPNFVSILKSEKLLTLPGNRVLVELPFHRPYSAFHQIIFDLQMKGYHPILAHPERYAYFNQAEQYAQIKSLGCALQINLLSLTGYYGKTAQTAAKTILNQGLADFLGTDLHHIKQAEQLQKALGHELVIQALEKGSFQNKLLNQ